MVEIPRLPDAIRSSLPPEVQAYIGALEAAMGVLQAQVQQLQERIRELEARLGQTSRNSSRPPSSDPPGARPRPPQPGSGRRRGAQPGHPRHERQLQLAGAVEAVIEHRPTACSHCHASLAPDLPDVAEPRVQQVWDIPQVQPEVTEHRYHRVRCPQCGNTVEGERPPEVPAGAFGAGVVALVGLLHGRYRLSVREIVALLMDVFHLPLSAGAVIGLCQLLSQALVSPYRASQELAAGAPSSNVDESGWKQGGKRRWLWVLVTAASTVFLVASQRSAKALQALLGEAFQGIVTSDRFKAYLALPVGRRQVCWAHLQRNWQALSERAGPVGEWAEQGQALIAQLFALWHCFVSGGLDRSSLQREMQPVQTQLRQLLEQGQSLPLAKGRAFCRDLLALWPALWTFVDVEGVEPTNNAAERALRPAVLWRKGCFGTQSDHGDVFVARILTTVATCRQQERHVLTFLTDAVQAYLAGRPAPALCTAP